jgi:hypothetical protein
LLSPVYRAKTLRPDFSENIPLPRTTDNFSGIPAGGKAEGGVGGRGRGSSGVPHSKRDSMYKSVKMVLEGKATSIPDYIEGESHPTSLDTIQISQQQSWLNSLVLKEQPLNDGGITREHVINDMKRRGYDIKNIRIWNRFSLCCRKTIVYKCDKGHRIFSKFNCMIRICPVCSGLRIVRIKKRYRNLIYQMKNPKMITVTIGQIPLNYPEIITHYRKMFYKFMRRMYKKIKSGFSALELSPNFHLHFHMVVDTPLFLPQNELSDEWFRISGRYVVYIRKCRPSKALGYIIKYVAKSPEFDSSNYYVDYLEITRNRRLLTTYGSLYGIKHEKEKKELLCELCGRKMKYCKTEVTIFQFMLDHFGSPEYIP